VNSQLAPAGRRPKGCHAAQKHRAAVVDHGDVLAEILNQVELMAGEEDGPATAGPQPQGLGQALHR
jgi:hypothetical protein